MPKRSLYIISQLIGWSIYILISFFINQVSGIPTNQQLIVTLATAYTLGITISHAYREIIIRYDWLNLSIIKIIPRFLLGSLSIAVLFEVLYLGITQLLYFNPIALEPSRVFQELVGWIVLFLLWSLIYFFYHFFKNYKAEEIKNLKWEATKNEIELNKLKSQLNPHFMFNSMNSIRALIDEDPKKAKQAVTQLSNVLRSNLLMGKQKLIPLEQELRLVADYLSVESYRYEERLNYSIDSKPGLNGILIPPLMIQTLVENGIKHGISKLPQGGVLNVVCFEQNNNLHIEILNSGKFEANHKPDTGFGMANTQERLKILFGNKATLNIKNTENQQVLTQVVIPKNNAL